MTQSHGSTAGKDTATIARLPEKKLEPQPGLSISGGVLFVFSFFFKLGKYCSTLSLYFERRLLLILQGRKNMNKVIQQLRKAREAKGMELKEVEEITKIRSKYLQAMEEENYCVLPGGVYTIGFLRSYARFLDLDEESVVNTYRMEVTATKLETTFDNNTTQVTNNRHRDQFLVAKILQLYREVRAIFRFLRINRMEESK